MYPNNKVLSLLENILDNAGYTISIVDLSSILASNVIAPVPSARLPDG